MKRWLILLIAILLSERVVASAQRSKDAVEVDPTHHHAIMENERVRVLEVLAEPGHESSMHRHPPVLAAAVQG